MTETQGRRYRILGTIGTGGFGTVYKAELLGEGGFAKVVALKVLNADVAGVGEVAQRLRDEARVLGLVRHRAIVGVDALCMLDGRWTVVMEFAEGVSVGDLVSRGPTPPSVALEIVGEVASALHAAREQAGPDGQPLALLHRDIKPSNLLVTRAGEVKVLDFGTARARFDAREAKTHNLAFGTLAYMSPERMEFVDTPAGDIYALGVVLWEVLTGETLGRTHPNPKRHTKRLGRASEHLQKLGLGAETVALVLSCLQYDADQRPSAEAVARVCRELRTIHPTPWLADWAADVVGGLLDARGPLPAGALGSRVLVEVSGRLHRPEPERVPERSAPASPAEPSAGHAVGASAPTAAPPAGVQAPSADPWVAALTSRTTVLALIGLVLVLGLALATCAGIVLGWGVSDLLGSLPAAPAAQTN
ncbi:MAG: serine/threonine protein kinase [Myxococcota bacterium]|jgi:serine/threonine protein kinase